MVTDLQKANLWKRIAAWVLDIMLLCVLAVGAGALLAYLLGYNEYYGQLNEGYARYETQYGVEFDITQEDYLALPDDRRENYDAAYAALIADEEVMHAYNMVTSQIMLIATLGILVGMLVLEFIVPLWLKNGQTVGKKVFALGVMRTDGVRITPVQLFVRTVLGKFTVETMIPVYVVLMLFFNITGSLGTVLLAGLGLAQIIILAATKTNAQLHDLLAGTVVVDFSSQRIFRSTGELIEYTKQIHAEKAAREGY